MPSFEIPADILLVFLYLTRLKARQILSRLVKHISLYFKRRHLIIYKYPKNLCYTSNNCYVLKWLYSLPSLFCTSISILCFNKKPLGLCLLGDRLGVWFHLKDREGCCEHNTLNTFLLSRGRSMSTKEPAVK